VDRLRVRKLIVQNIPKESKERVPLQGLSESVANAFGFLTHYGKKDKVPIDLAQKYSYASHDDDLIAQKKK
jgi:hypothetical protein